MRTLPAVMQMCTLDRCVSSNGMPCRIIPWTPCLYKKNKVRSDVLCNESRVWNEYCEGRGILFAVHSNTLRKFSNNAKSSALFVYPVLFVLLSFLSRLKGWHIWNGLPVDGFKSVKCSANGKVKKYGDIILIEIPCMGSCLLRWYLFHFLCVWGHGSLREKELYSCRRICIGCWSQCRSAYSRLSAWRILHENMNLFSCSGVVLLPFYWSVRHANSSTWPVCFLAIYPLSASCKRNLAFSFSRRAWRNMIQNWRTFTTEKGNDSTLQNAQEDRNGYQILLERGKEIFKSLSQS